MSYFTKPAPQATAGLPAGAAPVAVLAVVGIGLLFYLGKKRWDAMTPEERADERDYQVKMHAIDTAGDVFGRLFRRNSMPIPIQQLHDERERDTPGLLWLQGHAGQAESKEVQQLAKEVWRDRELQQRARNWKPFVRRGLV